MPIQAKAMTPAMTSRPFNFSAGPATMPAEVLAKAADEMLDWPDSSGKRCGMGVMEMSHSSKEFLEITPKRMTLCASFSLFRRTLKFSLCKAADWQKTLSFL